MYNSYRKVKSNSLSAVCRKRQEAENKLRALQNRIKHIEKAVARSEKKAVDTQIYTETVLERRNAAVLRIKQKQESEKLKNQELREAKEIHMKHRLESKDKFQRSRKEFFNEKIDKARTIHPELSNLRNRAQSPLKSRYISPGRTVVKQSIERIDKRRKHESEKIDQIYGQINELLNMEKSLSDKVNQAKNLEMKKSKELDFIRKHTHILSMQEINMFNL